MLNFAAKHATIPGMRKNIFYDIAAIRSALWIL